MKRRFALMAVVVVLAVCLAGCSSRNEPGTGEVNSVNPDTTPSTIPNDNLPENDANEGGGAGGTTDSNNGMDNSNDSMHTEGPGSGSTADSGQNNTGTNRDDGILDHAGDAAGDLMNGVGDALNDVGNAVRNGGRAIDRTINPKK